MTTPQPAALPERFTKKPVTIEAVQFRNDGSSYALIQWINEGQHAAGRRFASWQNQEIIVPTLEGEHIASPGDWIIKGVKGEFYPCKPDIFEMTYDLAALQSQPAAAGVSDDDLQAIDDAHNWQTLKGRMAAYRAILALRPQAVPMTDADLLACVVKANCLGGVPMSNRNGHYHIDTPSDAVVRLKDAIEAHHGITAQGAQGGEAK